MKVEGPAKIELLGGPLDGRIVAIDSGCTCKSLFAQARTPHSSTLHWYRLTAIPFANSVARARFSHSAKRKPEDDLDPC